MSRLIEFKSFVVSTLGNNTLLTPRGARGKLQVFSVLWNCESDITGEVKVLLGTRIISGARNPKTGALYGFNHNPNFVLSGPGESLVVSLPAGTAVTLDVSWREAPEYSSGD